MTKTPTDDVSGVSARPLEPGTASFLRKITTAFGLHRACPLKVCRRANACASRNVVCYQALEDEMAPIVRSIRARLWRRAVERGEAPDIAPASRDHKRRLLDWEERETGRIRSGEYGDDDRLTAYQLWLKHHAVDYTRRLASVDVSDSDGRPDVPDAKLC